MRYAQFAAFVRSIEPLLLKHGGCQVIPPPEWAHRPDEARARLRERAATTTITPLKQHVAGSNGRFQATMELLDAVKLDGFMETAEDAPPSIAAGGPEECDARFWRAAAAPPTPIYGADASEQGSLFDPSLREWNLGALPGGVEHDLTQALPMAIPGLNRSMCYFGRWRSFFGLHTEDCELQGASYLHYGQPKRWWVVPPSHASRVRSLAASLFPELADECSSFLRHKTTLISPKMLKASNIPCFSVLQTEGTFVLVASSAFHFGYNLGANCAEAVNFGLSSWLPKARTARPCTCDGNQTPHIEVPFLFRCLKKAHPEATADWWCFYCKCGETCTSFDDQSVCAPEGEQFECVGCGNWGHLECYADYAAASVAGSLPDELYCVQCTDAWRGGEHAEESWRFSCVCGRNEGASHVSVTTGDAPTGRMFQCDTCSIWAHTECYEAYRDVDDECLPESMLCHRCDPKLGRRQGGKAGPSTDAPRSPVRKTKGKASVATPEAKPWAKRAPKRAKKCV